MAKKAIIIFTRIPFPGKTKTRLMPYFSGKQCSALHFCFLKDIYAACKVMDADIFVAYHQDEGAELEALKDVLGKDSTYFEQSGKDLGERMLNAFRYVFSKKYGRVLLIGSDVPELQNSHLAQAFYHLRTKDTVFGPAADGGYYLVGMKRPLAIAFEGQTYSHERVLLETQERLLEHGVSVAKVGELHDLDTKEELNRFRQRMRVNKRLRRTATGLYLMKNVRISVIVPIYNERKTINKLQKQLLPYNKSCEIIFVDGGSTDGTLEMIHPEFRLIRSEKGRAQQMNLAAQMSQGDILFFLHCDSELPDNFLNDIKNVMKDHPAGCFGIAFHSPALFLWTCRVISNHRVKDRKVMFGDQGIFMDRELFFEVGMFPEIPIMEDYQLSLNLKEMNIPLGLAKHRIYTSRRRFPVGMWDKLEVMWIMNRYRKFYRDGVDIDALSRAYKDIR